MSRLRDLKDGQYYRKARKRLDSVGTGHVQDWAHTSLWATQQALEGHQVTGDPAALDEARRGALGILAAIDVLVDRSDK